MSFSCIKFFETEAEEVARLATAPEGSTNHRLAQLPVTNPHVDEHHLLELPWTQAHPCSGVTGGLAHECDGGHRIVVLPLTRHRHDDTVELPRQFRDSWSCRVVASDHPSYPVGGHGIDISESELRRSRVLEV